MTKKFLFPSSGKITFNLTNDYLFHIVFQKNHKALKGLIASLLNLEKSQITSISIRNCIARGSDISAKTCVLDLLVLLNKSLYINLEMQVKNNQDWADRSLFYLCRVFDQLSIGEKYTDTYSALNIGFLDFPFPLESNEFHAIYQLKNIKNDTIYSDKFTFSVIQLNQTNAAEPVDIENGLVDWIKFFKATDWKEVLILATKNPDIASAANSMFTYSRDANIYDECFQREEAQRIQNTLEDRVANSWARGLSEGRSEGEQRFRSLINYLMSHQLTAEFERALSDAPFCQELYKKYNL